MKALSILAVVASSFGGFFAYVTYAIGCSADSGESATCPDGSPNFAMLAELCLGILGVVAAVACFYYAFNERPKAAATSLVVGIAIWIAWGFCNDAAVHGSSAILPFLST